MKRYALYPIAVVLLTALVWISCGTERSPIAPGAVQQRPAPAAAKLAQGAVLDVEAMVSPLFVTLPDGRVAEKRVCVYYYDKVAGAGKGGKKDKGGGKCFSLFAAGARWKTTEPYVLDTTNGDELKRKFIISETEESLAAWDEQAPFNIFGPRDKRASVDGADANAPDGKNEVLFGAFNDPSIVAFTIVWGIFNGPKSERELIEWDMVLNDADYVWGNAGPTDETELGDTGVMDLRNIVTHEAGHAAGLDHPSDTCTEETMFAFVEPGETKKRTLHDGDIEGIGELYGEKGKKKSR